MSKSFKDSVSTMVNLPKELSESITVSHEVPKQLTSCVTTNYVLCANCQDKVAPYNTIITSKDTFTAKWCCDHCGCENEILFLNGDVISVKLTGDKTTKAIGLMMSEPDVNGNPIFLFIDVPIYAQHMTNGVVEFNDELADNMRYYYGTHTCPINWIKGSVNKILHDEDADPHGLFQLIGLWEHEMFYSVVNKQNDIYYTVMAEHTLQTFNLNERVVLTYPEEMEELVKAKQCGYIVGYTEQPTEDTNPIQDTVPVPQPESRALPVWFASAVKESFLNFIDNNQHTLKSTHPWIEQEWFEDLTFTEINKTLKTINEKVVIKSLAEDQISRFDLKVDLVNWKKDEAGILVKGVSFQNFVGNVPLITVVRLLKQIMDGGLVLEGLWTLDKLITMTLEHIPFDLANKFANGEIPNNEYVAHSKFETIKQGLYELTLTILPPNTLPVDTPKDPSTDV